MFKLHQFMKDESGSAAIEYAIITSGVAVAVITSMDDLGPTIRFTLKIIAATIGGGGPS